MQISAKAKASSWSATWTSAKASLSICVISVGISLFTAAYERALNPIFGGVATTRHMDYVVYGSTALGFILPKLPRSLLLFFLAILVQVTPHSSYWVSILAARNGDPTIGPLISHVTILAPVIYLAVSLASNIDIMLATLALAANALQLRPLILLVAGSLSLDTRKDIVFCMLGVLASFVWMMEVLGISNAITASNAANTRRRFWIMSMPAILLLPVLYSPTLTGSRVFPYQIKGYPLRILSSKASVTGIIVVGELLPPEVEAADSTTLHSIRYLRASHSLLGGVWIGPNAFSLDNDPLRTDQAGIPLGDSIYAAFVLQEAVRLTNRNSQTDDDARENALVIGLGAGISADAFIRLGISTTVVEIDPVVYDAARTFFGLENPGNDHVFLEDARNWVYKRRVAMQSNNIEAFDMVVHDCFSGGGVPEHLFSTEFWNDLKSIMKPDGVVAVNFGGRIGSQSTRAVATTLLRAFGTCRVFHDLLEGDPLTSTFLNMVFFCSVSQELTFRPAVHADYLHSPLRRKVFSSFDKWDVSMAELMDAEETFVLTDANNTLNAWQSEEALKHWTLMRNMLPDIIWETY